MNNIKLGNWDFNELILEDIDLYSKFIKESDCPTNRFSSNFAYLWANSQAGFARILWKIVDGLLVTFVFTRKNTLYIMCLPFGQGDADKVIDVTYQCLRYCNVWNRGNASETKVDTINSSQYDFLKNSSRFHRYFRLRKLMGLERFYGIENLLALSGKKFSNVRMKINKFNRNYPQAVIRNYEPGDFEQLLLLKEHWNQTAGKKYAGVFDDVAYRAVLKHYKELDHVILVGEVESQIAGMISGGPLPNGESWSYFLKTRSDFDGLSELLQVELAKTINRINPHIERINVGSDHGAGIQAFKKKFNPVLSLERFVVYPR